MVGAVAVVGLTVIGPVAGGIFAGAQACGWVTAGSCWALLQSIAMGGSVAAATAITAGTTVVGAGVGAGVGAVVGAKIERRNLN